MVNHSFSNRSDRQSLSFKHPLAKSASRLWLSAAKVIVAFAVVALASTANAQKTDVKPTLVPGSEVNLSAITGADWIQGEGPTAFEPDKIYVFECWATWCGPCVALIPHVNELHKKYYDQGLRVHGMNSWEEDKEKAVDFVKAKGEGMSYPVAFTNESAFQTQWLEAAGVKSIPHAFVVRNGKLLLATEASRLTESLVELMLSGDEGAKKAAAIIKSAQDNAGETHKLSQKVYSAKVRGDAVKMEALINKVKTLDPGYYQLAVWDLELLMVKKDWPAAVATLNKMPASSPKTNFLLATSNRIAHASADAYPMSFTKAFAPPYSEYITGKDEGIGPNHFANLTILYWRNGDKQTAISYADKGVEVASTFPRGSEIQTNAFKRFAKSVKEGVLPEFSELRAWQATARKEAAAKKKAAEGKPKAE